MVHSLPKLLAAQGFEDISSDYVSAPIGWNGRVGTIMKTCATNFWEMFRPALVPKLRLDEDEYYVSAPMGWKGRVGAIMKKVCRPMVMPKLGLDDDGR
ncbi:hypothetical protein BC938DRAFT_476706 [Jimgerdemannia flammicorona]|uniref:Uncharacterized protein n=1 Tax=Jimgerdemannia flammicorona TaxID=994334 RepID=A0A433QQA1_9FUNG|nr:hypothetical protein BC938DRAFT_476706 [Jimgerdemannia flammicorona]